MQIKSFRFNVQELGGALGDLGMLLPLMIALILFNGLNATVVLILGILFGATALSFLSLISLSVLGVLLVIVGIYHAFLIRDVRTKKQLAVVGVVAVVTIAFGSLAYGFGAGILLHYVSGFPPSQFRRRLKRAPGQRFHEPVNSRLSRTEP